MESVYVALYDLKWSHENVLAFKKGDRFIPLTSKTNNPNWAFCVDILGTIGYIPQTYIKQQPIPKEQLADFIDVVLETLEKDCTGVYTKQQRDVIQELTTWRTLLLSPLHSPIDAATAIGKGTPVTTATSTAKEVIPEPLIEKQSCDSGDQGNDAGEQSNDGFDGHNDAGDRSNDAIHPKPLCVLPKTNTMTQTELFECNKCKNIPISTQSTKNIEQRSVYTQHTEDIAASIKRSAFGKSVHSDAGDSLAVVNGLDDGNKQEDCEKCSSVSEVPLWLIPSLIENIRHRTQLSHQNSKVAVAVVLQTLESALPNVGSLWEQLKCNLDRVEVIQEEAENVIYSEDRRKLLNIFRQLWCCKNDEQQRSWPVHEDESLISSLLKDLNSILTDADPKVTKEIVQKDDYELVNLLVTYYQMETRQVLRVNMLHVFVSLCELDATVISQLLVSVLPMELARDMKCTFNDKEKLQYSAFVLTIMFSTGQKPPNAIYEFLDSGFLDFLFENVEAGLRDEDNIIGIHLLNVLLAFNLHFEDVRQNHVFVCLKDRGDARMLTEKLFYYANREENPVNILNKTDSPNSVLKFLVDFFAFPELVQLLYLNDIKVLLDIVVRQLTDYLPGEKKRILYLQLARNIVANSNYQEHFHQQSELQKCFCNIMEQEDPCREETSLVNGILNQYPDWFTLEIE